MFCLVTKASACLAGGSAAYQRTSQYGDDVVIVALSFFSLMLFCFLIISFCSKIVELLF